MNSLNCIIIAFIAGAGLLGWTRDFVRAERQEKRFKTAWVTAYHTVTAIAYMVVYVVFDTEDYIKSLFGACIVAVLLVGAEIAIYSIVRALHRCYLDNDIEIAASIARTKARKISDRTYGEMPQIEQLSYSTKECLQRYDAERLIRRLENQRLPKCPEFKSSLDGFTTPTIEENAGKDLSGIKLPTPCVDAGKIPQVSFLQKPLEEIVSQASDGCKDDVRSILQGFPAEGLKLIVGAMNDSTLENAG